MPLTGAERQRRYRQKLSQENPEKLLQQKRENLERTKNKYKKVSELTEKQQNLQREKWRREKQKCKEETIVKKTPEDKKKIARQRVLYFRKLKRENLNLKSTVAKLVKKTKTQNKQISRYKKKIEQLTQTIIMLKSKEQEEQIGHTEEFEENKDTPYSKTEKMIKETVPEISTPAKNTVKKILFENIVIKESLQKQYSQATNNSERDVLKKVVNNDMTKKYKMKTKLSEYVGLKGRLRVRQKWNKYKMTRLQELTAFYERDDNSRATAGKSEYRTLHKTRKQVRYLTDTLKNLHKKYKNEGGKLSYATFNRYKPFYVLSPKIVDRNTCACVKHANLSFMVRKLRQLRLLKTDSLTELVSTVACNINDKRCMYNECHKCSSKSFEFDLSQSQSNLTDIVSWNMWVTKQIKYSKNTTNRQSEEKITKRTVKEETTGSLQTLQQTFCTQLRLFKKHHFNIMHQFKMYTNCKNKLTESEIVVHCDFSENYICKFTEEVQAMHFGASKRQISLHTGVIYAKSEDGAQTISFCTISENNNHTPGAIWAHLTPVLKFVKQNFPAVMTIHFFTDGPTSQYRQKKNFYMMNTAVPQLGFEKATWSFFEASHGKGAADGVGGATKRSLDRYVVYGHDIPDAKAAYNTLVKDNTSKVKYFLVPDADVEKSIKMLDAISKNLIVVPETMSIHQVVSTPNTQIIKFRKLSCFCGEDFGFCDCFDLTEHNLNQKRKMIKAEAKTIKKRRLNTKGASKKQLLADESDTDSDIDITFAESDGSMYEIELIDSDEIEDNEKSIILVEDKTAENKYRGDDAIDITQDSDCMEKKVITALVEDKKFTHTTKIKEDKKVTVLSDIKLSLENQAFSNLQAYGPFKKINKNTDLFSTYCSKENVKNIYDDPVPSTSGIKLKQTKDVKIKIEGRKIVAKKTGIDNYNQDLRNTNLDMVKKQEDSTQQTAKKFKEHKDTNDIDLEKNTGVEKNETKKKKTEINEINEQVSNSGAITKNMEEKINYNYNLALTENGLDQKKNTGEIESEIGIMVEEQTSYNNNADLQGKIGETKIECCDDSDLYNFTVNDSVLVRYFEKNKWIYYVGFIESVQNENLASSYNIRFLKTVRKPELKFIFPKKDDKDTVPYINVVKKLDLKLESKEYVLCESERDSVYFI